MHTTYGGPILIAAPSLHCKQLAHSYNSTPSELTQNSSLIEFSEVSGVSTVDSLSKMGGCIGNGVAESEMAEININAY